MKIGQGNANFIFDAHNGVPAVTLKERLVAGHYGNIRIEFLEGWFELAGRSLKREGLE